MWFFFLWFHDAVFHLTAVILIISLRTLSREFQTSLSLSLSLQRHLVMGGFRWGTIPDQIQKHRSTIKFSTSREDLQKQWHVHRPFGNFFWFSFFRWTRFAAVGCVKPPAHLPYHPSPEIPSPLCLRQQPFTAENRHLIPANSHVSINASTCSRWRTQNRCRQQHYGKKNKTEMEFWPGNLDTLLTWDVFLDEDYWYHRRPIAAFVH